MDFATQLLGFLTALVGLLTAVVGLLGARGRPRDKRRGRKRLR